MVHARSTCLRHTLGYQHRAEKRVKSRRNHLGSSRNVTVGPLPGHVSPHCNLGKAEK